jgi:hypothetical protein
MAKISTAIFAVVLLLSTAASAIPSADADGPLCGASPLFATLKASPQVQPAALPMPFELAVKSQCAPICADGSTLSCPPGTINCESHDGACPGFAGYVVCDGTTTSCPAPCTNGTSRWTALTGCCCNDAGQKRGRLLHEQCVNCTWVYVGVECEGANCGGTCPK